MNDTPASIVIFVNVHHAISSERGLPRSIRPAIPLRDIRSLLDCAGFRTKMLFSFFSLSALGAISFLSHALTSVAGYAQLHRQPLGHQHMPRVPPVKDVQRATNHRRAGVHSVEVPLQELQMLQSESTTFRNWMSSWFSSASGTDSGVAGLKQEFQAYDGWISSWLDIAMSTNASAPSPIPSSVPLSTTESSPALPMTKGGELFQPSLGIVLSISQKSFGTAPPVSTPPASTSATPASVAPPTATSAPIPTTPSTGSCKFNAQASDNLAVYYGQTGATGQITLGGLCQDSNVNIVIVAFLTTYFGPGGYPTVNFGAACGSHQTSEMASKGATGLLSCPDLAEDITKCQDLGKLVLLSLGGADATTAFSSDSQATTFATQLWNLFGAGTGEDPGLRPFGDVKVDGFDIGKPFTRLT